MSNKLLMAEMSVLVTGATGYLGREMVWALARAGANVLVNSRSSVIAAKLVSDLRAAGLKGEEAVFDVTIEEEVALYFSLRGGKALNGLINNAYRGGAGTIKTASQEDYISSYESVVGSASRMLRYSLPSLRRSIIGNKTASVVNIASMYGLVSPDLRVYDSPENSNPPFYGAAKSALIQWSKYAACEFGIEGIRVNSISPGPFPSSQVQVNAPDFIARLAKKVPLNRIGRAEEIGGPILFLCSELSSYVNGANIAVDGGWTAW